MSAVAYRRRSDAPTPDAVAGKTASAIHDQWETLLPAEPPTDRFDPDALGQVPDAARRWLAHSVAAGAPLYRAAVAEMEGEIRIGRWMPFKALQLHAPPAGYIWAARAGLGPIRISGFDRYVGGEGSMHWRLFGQLPMVNSAGPDVSRSAAGRLALDAFLVPTAFTSPNVKWVAGDSPSTFVAVWQVNTHELPVRMTVDEHGRLLSAEMRRWGNPNGRQWGAYPCGGLTAHEVSFDGVTAPTELRAGWFFGAPGWTKGEFFRARITAITYL